MDASVLVGPADGSVIAASGFAAVLLAALVERLRRTFATRHEVAALRRRGEALQKQCSSTRELSLRAYNRADATHAELERERERLNGHVLVPLQRGAAKLESIGEMAASHASTLRHLEGRLGAVEEAFRSSPWPGVER